MTNRFIVALLTTAGVLAAAMPAQAGLALGDRPIKRTEVIATVKAQFAEMDTNHDGFVTAAEADRYREKQNAMPDQGRGLTHIGRSWMEKTDANGDGKVSVAEAQDRPLQMFDMADVNRDGVASLQEQSVAALFVK